MIKLEQTDVYGWEAAIRGMRNPKNSWDKSDSTVVVPETECPESCYLRDIDKCECCNDSSTAGIVLGTNDHDLMNRLAAGGPVHAKYRRMIVVYVDITAPLYWWKEFDTYKVGTVANSCSTMHKIADKEFEIDDFSHEQLIEHPVDNTEFIMDDNGFGESIGWTSKELLELTIKALNHWRDRYLETKSKTAWWQMIQLLPSSYNQKRTVMLNYEVLAGIYPMRKNHKLDEWHDFCKWIEGLPYSEIIIGAPEHKGLDALGEELSCVALEERMSKRVDTIKNNMNTALTPRNLRAETVNTDYIHTIPDAVIPLDKAMETVGLKRKDGE